MTFQEYGLNKILDLGERWFEKTSLPIPLGLDLVHKKFSPEHRKEITTAFYKSIKYFPFSSLAYRINWLNIDYSDSC